MAESYDATANPLVALDRRHTPRHLGARAGEAILDAGCGTGGHLRGILAAGARPLGLDFSRGMLRVARRTMPEVPLAQADLNVALPVHPAAFDAVLCALLSEHLASLRALFRDAFAALRRGGRLVFSAFHPVLATVGAEANFEVDGTEYRLGAERHTVDDFLNATDDAGFRDLRRYEYWIDGRIVDAIPSAAKHRDRPVLLVIEACRPPS
ncbi:MAG: class I SAM-dependent methyltransferase [Candidatus Binatia bacterium]